MLVLLSIIDNLLTTTHFFSFSYTCFTINMTIYFLFLSSIANGFSNDKINNIYVWLCG